VDVAAVAVEVEARDQLGPPRGDALALGVFEFPDAGVRGGVEGAVVPEDALREHQPVGEDLAGVERAVAVGVFEEEDAAELLLDQLLAGQVGAGALGDEESSAVVEAGEEGVAHQRRPGDLLDDEPLGDLEAVGRLGRRRPGQEQEEGGSREAGAQHGRGSAGGS
jgi:hypothetical protein